MTHSADELTAEIRRLAARYMKEGPSAMADIIDDDIRICSCGPKHPMLPFSGEWRGRSGLDAYMDQIWSTLELVSYEVESVEPLGPEKFLVLATQKWRHRSSRREFETPKAEISTYRNGKCIEFREFWDSGSALLALQPNLAVR